jgi:hypothetical protein
MARRLVPVACIATFAWFVGPPAARAAVVSSTFDSGPEGWVAVGDVRVPATFVESGGNPGGFVRVTDAAAGGTMYWQAPARFRQASRLYGGQLSFDLRQSDTTSQFDDADVVLVGGGLTLTFDTATTPGRDWTRYRVALRETAGWRNASRAATRSELRRALGALTALRIRAEYRTGPDTDDLDNVVLRSADEPPPPEAGRSVVAAVVSGVVRIRLPAGKRIRRGRRSATSSGTRFLRYRGRANIPVGSTIDTRRGRLALTSAADLRGSTQRAVFYGGVFQVRQRRSARPVTDADVITSRTGCPRRSARGSARRRVVGRLWASAKGRFRTRGRYSAATVRGTIWLTEERCDGTLTRVRTGSVSVRDRISRRLLVLRAGQSYVARFRTRGEHGAGTVPG